MMKRIVLTIIIAALAVSCGHQKEDVCGYVNPFIGTAYTGHTFPNAACPFGAMQPALKAETTAGNIAAAMSMTMTRYGVSPRTASAEPASRISATC